MSLFLVFLFLALDPQQNPPEAEPTADLYGKACRSSLGISRRSAGSQFCELLHFRAVLDKMAFLLAEMAGAGLSLPARFL